jgi:prepilin-type processing-associated H-X9-DG protein
MDDVPDEFRPTHPIARFTPSGRMMFVESLGKSISSPTNFRFRHSKKINMAFMDGHCEMMPDEPNCPLNDAGAPQGTSGFCGGFSNGSHGYALLW